MKTLYICALILITFSKSLFAYQMNFDELIKKHQQKLQTNNILISIMDAKTGEIIFLNDKNLAVDYLFEPASSLKPIIASIALNNNVVKKDDSFFIYNKGEQDINSFFPYGSFEIEKHTINNEQRFTSTELSLEDIVLYSSNIGIIQIAKKLKTKDFQNGLKDFGLIDKLVAKEKNLAPNETQFLGQNITVNFIQMMKAYLVFNNDGYILKPFLNNKENINSKNILEKNVANDIKNLLIKRYEYLSKRFNTSNIRKVINAQIGISLGSSFDDKHRVRTNCFGLVNYNDKKYIVGILVANINVSGEKWYYKYAVQSAMPLFNDVIDKLILEN